MSPTPDPVRWHKDLLVTPTSQQLLSLRLESLIRELAGRYQPYFWGVRHVEYELDDLKGGVLTVRALDAVLRDGDRVTVDPRAPVRLALAPGDTRRLLVYVTARQEALEQRRFVPCEHDDAGDPVGEDGVAIPFLRTRVELHVAEGPAPTAAGTSFPLCEVRGDAASWHLTDFMPPTLRVGRDSPLGRQCAGIPAMLREEARSVADRARLQALVSALPAFEVLLGAEPHPLALYIELCRLAGAAAVLRNHSVPPQFPEYLHDAARAGFDDVVRFVTGSTEEPTVAAVRRLTFDREGLWFRLPSSADWTDALDTRSRRQLILAVETDAGEARAQRWGDNCVIGTRGAVDALLSKRVLGLPRRRVSPGAGLPSRHDLYFFRLLPDAEAVNPGDDLLALAELAAVKDHPGLVPSALHLFVVEAEAGAR